MPLFLKLFLLAPVEFILKLRNDLTKTQGWERKVEGWYWQEQTLFGHYRNHPSNLNLIW